MNPIKPNEINNVLDGITKRKKGLRPLECLTYTWTVPGLLDPRAALEGDRPETDGIDSALIRQELNHILESRHFRHSKRAQQFLQFVVEQKISGNEEQIKERLIGVEVFGRDIDYATGDDPVVRVQAGEVRRRLELYQADVEEHSLVTIELPLGSYVPVFHRRIPMQRPVENVISAETPILENDQEPEHSAEEPSDAIPVASEITPSVFPPVIISANPSRSQPHNNLRLLVIGICACLALAAVGAVYVIRSANNPATWTNAFWGPVASSARPVFICLGKPILYLPSDDLFKAYDAKHPGTFPTTMERHNRVLPLDPQETIRWSQMEPIYNSGPAMGGVRAAMNISALFGSRKIPFSVRFGNEASFDELRESPAVIIGALNNRWMSQMSSDLHFAMQETGGRLVIHENGPGSRTWGNQAIPTGWRDYGLVTRQLWGPTGQFTVKIEGIGDGGTEAGSEVISDPENLRSVLQSMPKNWEKKNIQLVVSTDITEGKPGPPKLVAFYIW